MPMTATLLVTIKKEKIAVDVARIAYEQSQKIELGQEIDSTWQTGETKYDINLLETNQKKGIQIQCDDRKKKVEILATEIIKAE